MSINLWRPVVSKLCFASLLCLIAAIPGPSHASMSQSLSEATSYKIYYDPPNKRILTEMQRYDVVILEPLFYTSEQIDTIRQSGTLVYGYINVLEADRWNTAFINRLEESDFFHRNGKRVYYEEWDSYLTDIASTHYQEVLLEEVNEQIVSKGIDGAFLDTVGNIDNEHGQQVELLEQQREGLRLFLQQIKEQHPTLSLIQNWGFQTLKTTTYPYVDGIMWENFHYASVSNDEWSQERIKDLTALQDKQDITVLTVSMEEEHESRSYANSLGFTHFHTSEGYNSW
ncbi:putative glycoside hydrolase [Pontibacillus halophilus]|uniref:putative glycoside hydrolase n=1 Tax=Pontibacillus halophilus TaxID=516704 RepID=UPI001E30A387|nr:putative glycoside hydrolase [Pontibacillus halophilus]